MTNTIYVTVTSIWLMSLAEIADFDVVNAVIDLGQKLAGL